MIKVSIITVCYNAAATLPDTLRSVASQTYSEIEHIVVDGGSTDTTVDVVGKHGRHVARFVSEPDRGLYDAMNKGLSLASGEVIAYLNADDWYASPDSVAQAVSAFDVGVDLVHGDLNFVHATPPHRVTRVWQDAARGRRAFMYGWHPAHPATFMRAALLRRVGGFDTRFRIAADYAMFARCFLREHARAVHIPRVLTNMRMGGVSTSGGAALTQANRECIKALREAQAPMPTCTVVLKLTRKLFQLRPASGETAWLP